MGGGEGGRFLAEVEMRLHLTAEDVEAALEEASSRALMRIPTALEEVTHVKVGTPSPVPPPLDRWVPSPAVAEEAGAGYSPPDAQDGCCESQRRANKLLRPCCCLTEGLVGAR